MLRGQPVVEKANKSTQKRGVRVWGGVGVGGWGRGGGNKSTKKKRQ